MTPSIFIVHRGPGGARNWALLMRKAELSALGCGGLWGAVTNTAAPAPAERDVVVLEERLRCFPLEFKLETRWGFFLEDKESSRGMEGKKGNEVVYGGKKTLFLFERICLFLVHLRHTKCLSVPICLSVLVCLTGRNKTPWTGQLQHHICIPHSSAGWGSEITVPDGRVLDEGSLPGF